MDDTDIPSGSRGSNSGTLNTTVAKAIEVPIGFSHLSRSPAGSLCCPFCRIPAPGFVFLFFYFYSYCSLSGFRNSGFDFVLLVNRYILENGASIDVHWWDLHRCWKRSLWEICKLISSDLLICSLFFFALCKRCVIGFWRFLIITKRYQRNVGFLHRN